jgi:hypothetical protein
MVGNDTPTKPMRVAEAWPHEWRLADPQLGRVREPLLGSSITATLAANVAHGRGHGTIDAVVAVGP